MKELFAQGGKRVSCDFRIKWMRMKSGRFIWIIVVSVLLLNAPCVNASEEALKIIPTRPNVTQPFLLIRPADHPVASVILFAGGHGRLELSALGMRWGEGNFLVRNRERFAQQGFVVAVVDAPSDRPQGLWNFRTSAAHAEDIKNVIAELKKVADTPVWLIGTSMGTVSAANAAARLKQGGPDGLVLTSSVTKESRQVGETVNAVRLKDIRVPTLVVHHRRDDCAVTPYELAVALTRSLTHAPKKELLAFSGGDFSISDPCEARSYHGFMGLDAEVVTAVASWIKAASTPK
jgi:predicted alpha/beta-hydrolase family hydrolase